MSQLPPPKPASEPDPNDEVTEDSQESYSLDEMMRRLKDGEKEKEAVGEIVTLDDGRHVRRIKKRKRRSEQTEKKPEAKNNKKRLILQIAAICSVLILLLIYMVVLYFRLNTSSYRENVQEVVQDWIGGEVDFDGMSVSPSTVSMKKAHFAWGDSSFIKELSMDSVTADLRLRHFLAGKLTGSDLGGRKGYAKLQWPTSDEKVFGDIDLENPPYDFARYYCTSFDVDFADGEKMNLKGVNTTLRYINGKGYQVLLDKGHLKLEGWKAFPLDKVTLEVDKKRVKVIGLRLKDPLLRDINSKLLLSGEISLEDQGGSELTLTTDRFPLDIMAGDALGEMLEGDFRSEQGVVIFEKASLRPQSVSVPFTSMGMRLKKLPVWTALDTLFPDQKIGETAFTDNVTGTLIWTPEGSGIKDLTMSQAARVRVTGNIVVSKEGKLTGRLGLRISKGILKKQAIFRDNEGVEFSEADKGYELIFIKLGGTVDEPTDNFRKIVGMDTGLLENDKIEQKESFEDLFENLLNDE